ncbi:MAG: STAS domain-containing protein, partial [Pseudomonadota bacterium]
MFEIIIKPEHDLVDFQAWDKFAELMQTMVEAAEDKIILDLSSVNRMSSNYIGSLISTHKKAQEVGKAIILINVRPRLLELLEMLKLTDLLTVEP